MKCEFVMMWKDIIVEYLNMSRGDTEEKQEESLCEISGSQGVFCSEELILKESPSLG